MNQGGNFLLRDPVDIVQGGRGGQVLWKEITPPPKKKISLKFT